MKKILLAALCLVVFFGFTATSALAWGKKEADTEAIAVKFLRETQSGGYGVVSTTELDEWIKDGKEMLVIDTMPYESSYKKGHIPGAVCFELPIPEMKEMDDKTKTEFLELLGPDKDRLIVVYCGFTKCGRSHNGALWAKKLGYSNVYRCPGGIKGWKENGFEVSKVK